MKRSHLGALVVGLAALLGFTGSTLAGTPPFCVVLGNDADISFVDPSDPNPETRELPVLQSPGTSDAESIAWNWDEQSLWAIDEDTSPNRMGYYDLATPAWVPCPLNLEGDLGAPQGVYGGKNVSNVRALTYHRGHGVFYAVRSGSTQLLFALSSSTCAYVPDHFGAGVDYVPLSGGTSLSYDAIAYEHGTGLVYVAGADDQASGGNQRLYTLDVVTGALTQVAEVTGFPVDASIEGLSFDGSGDLWASGDDVAIAKLDPVSGVASGVTPLLFAKYGEGLECSWPYSAGSDPCDNGVQDDSEAGVDCGGVCPIPCCDQPVLTEPNSSLIVANPGLPEYVWNVADGISVAFTISEAAQPGTPTADGVWVQLQSQDDAISSYVIEFSGPVWDFTLTFDWLEFSSSRKEILFDFERDGIPALLGPLDAACAAYSQGDVVRGPGGQDGCSFSVVFTGRGSRFSFRLEDAGSEPGDGVAFLAGFTRHQPCCAGDLDCDPDHTCDVALNECALCIDDHPVGEVDSGCSDNQALCSGVGLDASCSTCFDDGPAGQTDQGCGGLEPFCWLEPSTGTCVECVADTDCGPSLCDPVSHTCVECVDSGDCSSGTCDANVCNPCVDDAPPGSTDTGCPAALPICDVQAPGGAACTGCVGDSDCQTGICEEVGGTCVPCLDVMPGGNVDAGCNVDMPICGPLGCVACFDSHTLSEDDGCVAAAPHCSAHEGSPGCYACVTDDDCPGTLCVGGACVQCSDDSSGVDTGCIAEGPHCTEKPDGSGAYVCVECVTDGDCPDQICGEDGRCQGCTSACQSVITAVDDSVNVVAGETKVFDVLANDLGVVAPETLHFPEGVPQGFLLFGHGEVGYQAPAGVSGQTSALYAICDALTLNCDDALIVVHVGQDTDRDGVLDRFDRDDDDDGIPDTAEVGDFDGDLLPDHHDLDSDGDGIPDLVEAGGALYDRDGDGRVDRHHDANSNGMEDALEAAPLNDIDRDGDTWPDRRDLDSDGDGLPDRLEALRTGQTLPPLGSDADADGLDDAYDVHTGGFVIRPVNTDTVDAPDYQDLDSDNDHVPDAAERVVLDGLTPVPVDSDLDGAPDFRDADDDGDLLLTALEDTDGDGDPRNDDDDGDGDPNYLDAAAPGDSDGDGVDDKVDVDLDNDGLTNGDEGSGDPDHDGLPNFADLDSDGDGLPDISESGRGSWDADGDGRIDVLIDTDGDGFHDEPFTLPEGPSEGFDLDLDGLVPALDADSDGDGIPDLHEVHPWTLGPPTPAGADHDGDGIDDAFDVDAGAQPAIPLHTDDDGVPDMFDLDSDGDSVPDGVEGHDLDGDGVADGLPGDDLDGDGLADGWASLRPNHDGDPLPDFRDRDDDGDGLATMDEDLDGNGDPRDDDEDEDGVPDYLDAGLEVTDGDGDGLPASLDADDDGDGVLDVDEGFGLVDSDGDGKVDSHDLDSDGDGIRDRLEAQPVGSPAVEALGVDQDGDGLDAAFDSDEGGLALGPVDGDGDGVPDRLDLDSDGDGVLDSVEGHGPLADGSVVSTEDANGDGLLDMWASSAPDRVDRDGDGRPDWRDADDDGDGIPTATERLGATDRLDRDTDDDGLDDGLEVALGLDPTDADGDDDGLADGAEVTTDPEVADSDEDGLLDGLEAGATSRVPGGLSDGVGIPFVGTEGPFAADADPSTTTDPADDDSDDDGLLDGAEDANRDGAAQRVLGGVGSSGSGETDPSNPDTDGDGILDGTELSLQQPDGDDTDLARFVPDADSQTTDPLDTDSDDGGVGDGAEDADHDGAVGAGETDPLDASDDDSDGDGLSDDLELQHGTNVSDPDTDGDGLADGAEVELLMHPLDIDSDDDGLSDGLEAALGTDPRLADTDGDGLADGLELGVTMPLPGSASDAAYAFAGTDTARFVADAQPSTTTDPTLKDSDGDGLDDGVEDADGDGAWRAQIGGTGTPGGGETNPAEADTDGDGLDDKQELEVHGTSPVDLDSDDGSVPDGVEVLAGEDPLDPSDDVVRADTSGTVSDGCVGGGGAAARGSLGLGLLVLALMWRRRGRAARAARR